AALALTPAAAGDLAAVSMIEADGTRHPVAPERIANVQPLQNPIEGQGWVVAVHLDTEGARWFAELTERSVGQRLGIAVDGVVILEPKVQIPIRGGVFWIGDRLDAAGAEALAARLRPAAP
ncbi:MAG: hypothetical protein AAFX62_18195, partial [Pseudomonadota bacterium]